MSHVVHIKAGSQVVYQEKKNRLKTYQSPPVPNYPKARTLQLARIYERQFRFVKRGDLSQVHSCVSNLVFVS